MTKAALMPTPGDPFLLKFWFFLFEKYWQNEVDRLYVLYNSRMELPVVEFVRSFMTKNPKVVFLYEDHMIEHGNAIKALVNICQEDMVMLGEDDGMIFKEGAVKEQFEKIESGKTDIVASQRQSSTLHIAEIAQQRFGTWNTEAFFWPNFFFIEKKYLLETDQHFGAKRFDKGEHIAELNWIVDEESALDTFGWTSIQLRAKGLRIDLVDQYHAMAEDLIFFREKIKSWKGDSKWCHLGSLSGMMTNFLYDDAGYPLESRSHRASPPIDPNNIPKPVDIANEGPKQDFESRVANVLLAFERTQGECDAIAEFRDQYRRAIDRLVKCFELRTSLIQRKIDAYKILYTMHV